ncbi:helix-turn-helix domain-containing protein [Sinomonas sp. JGH33]|uniref:Helix-turn-helix domain-containing protein n=2 Tax=Sinomonas terricola TaxID=3110330 RepID=A0ABU5T0R6_9MICC|nr:helix-turn-helix domain-containing protein [Sinomonas sp. JGH33]
MDRSKLEDRKAFNVQQAAELCGVSPDVIRRAIARGDLIARYPSSRPIVEASELDTWLDRLPTEPPGR